MEKQISGRFIPGEGPTVDNKVPFTPPIVRQGASCYTPVENPDPRSARVAPQINEIYFQVYVQNLPQDQAQVVAAYLVQAANLHGELVEVLRYAVDNPNFRDLYS